MSDQPTSQPIPEPDPLAANPIDERRREALARICAESAQLRLPMPMQIQFWDGIAGTWPGITLRLDEGQRDGVHAWAGHLGIEMEDEHTFDGEQPWVRVKASTWNHDGPIWLEFMRVDVWCSCPVPEGNSAVIDGGQAEPKCTPECDALHNSGAPTGLDRSWHADNCPVSVHHHAAAGETACGVSVADLPAAHGYGYGDWDAVTCKDCLRTAETAIGGESL